MSDAEQNGEAGGKMQRKKLSRNWENIFNRSIVNSHRWDQTTSMKEEDTGVIKTGKVKAWQEF